MVALRETIEALARWPDGPPVVSVYLDARWRDEQQRERVRLFVRDRAREARATFAGQSEAAGLERTFERIERFVDGLVNQDVLSESRGLVLVASEPRGAFEAIAVDAAFTLAVHVDTRPRLCALIEAWTLERPAVLVGVDSAEVSLVELEAGRVADEHAIARDVPNRHAQGGWSQRKFQRHVKEHIRAVWKEGARQLEQLALADRSGALVLLGQEPNVRAFGRELPEWLRARVVGVRPWPHGRRQMLDVAREVLAEERGRYEFEVVHRILRQGLSDRTGTVGLSDTLLAVDERRVRVLVMSRRFEAAGYRCGSCEALWESGAPGCVFCGAPTASVNLREELARRALAQGAELVVTSETTALDAYRGLGALLRHLTGEEHRRMGSMPSVAPAFARSVTS